ncbi:MAG: hypothetical protein L6V93_15035 [Clostridiales bacterium]|nr:MAG: hypothetical protein L6V93_15035 [Clostridiales bacterium]
MFILFTPFFRLYHNPVSVIFLLTVFVVISKNHINRRIDKSNRRAVAPVFGFEKPIL